MGESIDWTLSGNEAQGAYRYEAMVLMEMEGRARPRTLPGGFEVKGSRVIFPLQSGTMP